MSRGKTKKQHIRSAWGRTTQGTRVALVELEPIGDGSVRHIRHIERQATDEQMMGMREFDQGSGLTRLDLILRA